MGAPYYQMTQTLAQLESENAQEFQQHQEIFSREYAKNFQEIYVKLKTMKGMMAV